MTPAVGVASYRLRSGPDLARTPLSEIAFPLGLREDLVGGVLGDLGPEDHILLFPKSSHYRPGALPIAAIPSLIIAEPRAVHGWHMGLLRLFHRRFHRVLTRDQRLLRQIPNGVFYNHTFSFVDAPEAVDTTKTALCSLIASGKRDQEGHRLRHRIVERVRAEGLEIDVMGRGYAPFESKADGLAPYHYSVVIENSREPAYITEKLIDAALCRTVPIYWGAPDVGDWFDTSGMILCETEDQIVSVLRNLGDRNPSRFAPAIEANRATALNLMQGKLRAAETLAESIGAIV